MKKITTHEQRQEYENVNENNFCIYMVQWWVSERFHASECLPFEKTQVFVSKWCPGTAEGELKGTYFLLASQTSVILEKRWWLSVFVIVSLSSLEFLNIRIKISKLSKYECSEDITSKIAW